MRKLNKVLLILLFPLYVSAANYPAYSNFCPKGMYITGYELSSAVKSSKEAWGNNNIARDSIYVSNGCLTFYVGLDNQKSNVDWIKKNHPISIKSDTVYADVYNFDKTPSKLYFAAIGNITFKSDEGMLKCDNVVIGKGRYNQNGINGNWWLFNNSNEPGFNKKHTLRCQIIDASIRSGTHVQFSTTVIKKQVKKHHFGAPTITSIDDNNPEGIDNASDGQAVSEKKFGAPTITSIDDNDSQYIVNAPDIEAASKKKFGAPRITSEDQ